MQKMLKLILCTNLLSPIGFCTTVSSTVNIQNSNLSLSRQTTVADSGRIIIQGDSSFTQNDNTLQNNGIIDIAGYTNNTSTISMSITGTAGDTKGLILGKAGDPNPICIDPSKITSITVAPDQTVHYYYTNGTTQYTIADDLDEDSLIKLDSKTTDEIGVDKASYTNKVSPSSDAVKWKNDGPDAGEDINVTITTVANSYKNLTENTLNLTTEGLDPVLDAGSPSVNVKLIGNASITFKGISENIGLTDKFEFAGDNSGLGTQTLPANATMVFTGSKSLFPHNAVNDDIGELVFGDGEKASENSISNDIRTKKLTINTSAKLTIDSEKSLIITGYGSNISGTIEIINGGSIVF